VRVEEYINYFDYDYLARSVRVAIHLEGSPSPFVTKNTICCARLQGRASSSDAAQDAVLTFVIDVRSMVRAIAGYGQTGLNMLVEELRPTD